MTTTDVNPASKPPGLVQEPKKSTSSNSSKSSRPLKKSAGGQAPDTGFQAAESRRLASVKRIISYVLLSLFALVYLGPFLLSMATSFKTSAGSIADPLGLIPRPVTTFAWRQLFGITKSVVDIRLGRWTLNSIVVTATITAGRVALASMAGYALARIHFPGRRQVLALILGVMMVPGVVLLIPRFLILKELSLRNTYMGMILPLLVDCAAIYLMKQNFEALPVAVEEAATIDGASMFRTFRTIVLPMARPSLIAITVLSVQGAWNEFTMFLVANDRQDLNTLTLGLSQFKGGLGSGSNHPLLLGAALLTTIPIVVVFFTFQRYFTGDLSDGSDK
jgi:multiple sugar transport system permease protein